MIEGVVKNPTVIAQLTARLSDMSGPRAANHLCYTFKRGSYPIILAGVSTTVAKLVDDFDGFEYINAKDIGPIRFYGGPPQKRKWYSGSLLSILVDAVLESYASGDSIAFYKFLESTGKWLS
jgi:hypothetical protein